MDYLLPTVSKDFAGSRDLAHQKEGSEMAQGCSSPSGSDPGVGEAADVALIPSVHPGRLCAGEAWRFGAR